jgi:hypothetical protein
MKRHRTAELRVLQDGVRSGDLDRGAAERTVKVIGLGARGVSAVGQLLGVLSLLALGAIRCPTNRELMACRHGCLFQC